MEGGGRSALGSRPVMAAREYRLVADVGVGCVVALVGNLRAQSSAYLPVYGVSVPNCAQLGRAEIPQRCFVYSLPPIAKNLPALPTPSTPAMSHNFATLQFVTRCCIIDFHTCW
jgi:hypothetical protein